MIKAILNNPYRILGVYSNSPKKEQVANKGKMQAFLRVKKSMPFKLDLQGILPDVQRTQDLVDYADSELALPAGQIKHAQFWFINKTPIDGVAFNHLTDGNINSAIDFWKKSTNMSSLQNLFVCYLIKEDYKSAIIHCAILLYNEYAKEFVATIDENASISKDTLIQTIIDTISSDGIDLLSISGEIVDDTWKKLIETKKVEPLITQLNAHVADAKSAKGNGDKARLNAGNKLKIASKPLLATLNSILSSNDTRYQIIADKVAQEVLQCSIDYYNDTEDVDSPAKALPLCEYAMSIAVGNAAKQRCEQNYDVIKNAYESMPPVEVAKEAREINELLSWYHGQEKTSKMGLELLKKAQKPLIIIKEKIGKTHNYYLETSSLIGNAALSNVIDEVNEAQKEDQPNPLGGLFGSSSQYSFLSEILGEEERRRTKAYKLKAAFRSAWQTILYIDRLDKTDDFNKNRYQPNRKTLYSIINGLRGFDYPDDKYIIKGCAHGLTADLKFFWSDSEHYNECTSKSDFKRYLSKFPSGIHVEEAEKKIKEFEEKEKRIWKYVGIAAAIAILLFIIILAANGKSESSKSYSEPKEISTPYNNEVVISDVNSINNYQDYNGSISSNRARPDYYDVDDIDLNDDIELDEDIDLDDDIDLDSDIDFDDDFDIDDDF